MGLTSVKTDIVLHGWASAPSRHCVTGEQVLRMFQCRVKDMISKLPRQDLCEPLLSRCHHYSMKSLTTAAAAAQFSASHQPCVCASYIATQHRLQMLPSLLTQSRMTTGHTDHQCSVVTHVVWMWFLCYMTCYRFHTSLVKYAQYDLPTTSAVLSKSHKTWELLPIVVLLTQQTTAANNLFKKQLQFSEWPLTSPHQIPRLFQILQVTSTDHL